MRRNDRSRQHISWVLLLLVFSSLTGSLTLIAYSEIIANPIRLPEAARLVSLVGVAQQQNMNWPGAWNTPAYSAIGVFQTAHLTIGDEPNLQETVLACIADSSFFDVLSMRPERGRLLNDEDEQAGSVPVAIVSDAFWRSHFGNTEDLSAAKFFAAGRWIHVVGVLPARVDFPAHAAVYLPHPDQRLSFAAYDGENWSRDDFSRGNDLVIARLRPGVTIRQADAMEKALVERMRRANTDPRKGFGAVGVRRFRDTVTRGVKNQLTIITVAGCSLTLVALVSLFFLSAARAAELRKDMAIRIALGAGIWSLFRRELIWWTSVGLAASSAVLLCTEPALRSAQKMEALAIPRLEDLNLTFSQGLWIVAGTMTIALLLAIPYLLACRKVEPVTPILNRGESLSRLAIKPLIGKVVSIAQLSLAVALTAIAMLVSVNYWRIVTTPPGLDVSRVFISQPILSSSLNLGNRPEATSDSKSEKSHSQDTAGSSAKIAGAVQHSGAQGVAQVDGLFDAPAKQESAQDRKLQASIAEADILDAVKQMKHQPGIDSVAVMSPVPYEPTAGGGQFIQINGRESQESIPVYSVHGNVLQAIGIRLLAGRWFNDKDESDRSAVVIGDALSKMYFSGQPIGKTIVVEAAGETAPRTIIGVVDNVVPNYGLGVGPAIYIPMNSDAAGSKLLSLVVKMASGVTRSPFPIRNVPGGMLQFQPWTSMSKMMSDAGATDRASAMVAVWFAVLVLLLAAAGAYAVFWMITIQRQREMAIRICFGALPARIALGFVLNAIALAVCAGIGGFAIQQALQRVLSSKIYDFPVFSWTTFLISFGVITAATLLSVVRPAKSILRLSPAELLRDN